MREGGDEGDTYFFQLGKAWLAITKFVGMVSEMWTVWKLIKIHGGEFLFGKRHLDELSAIRVIIIGQNRMK